MARKRILVVDDLAIFREPISVTLEAHGFKILTASGGKEALSVIQSQIQPLDLLIVDYSMPEMNGIDFIEQARTYPQVSEAPVIFLTDMADKEIVMQAYKSGAQEYILKSNFSITSLLEKVEHSLQFGRGA